MANIDIPIGTSVASANTLIAGANAGDFVRFERGGTWVGQIVVAVNGSSGNPITLTAYGSGARPILTTKTTLPGWDTGGNWTDTGGNVWSKALSINSQNTNYRVWPNGTEYSRAVNAAAVTSTKRVSYNVDVAATLYVYATSNPASFYSLIEYSGIIDATLQLNGPDYITVSELDIRGGAGASIDVVAANHITIENCNIGWDGARIGIRKSSNCDDIIIQDNTIDSGDRLPDNFLSARGTDDGINIYGGGATNWIIRRNTIQDWGHSCVGMDVFSGTASNIEVYDNKLTAENVDYCRGIGFDAITGSNPTNIKIYRNLIYKTNVQVQLNCPNLEFYSNIINGTTNSTTANAGSGRGIAIQGYSGRSPINMKIYNNVIANCESEGLRIARSVGYEMATGNEITNNIFYNNGELSPDAFDDAQIIIVPNPGTTITGNTFRNNLLYKSGVTDRIVYDSRNVANVFMTIAEFNARNGSDSDVITGNLSADPLFVDNNADFSLQTGSPAKNAGIDLGSPYNVGLIASTWPDDVNTGLQTGDWNLGSYVEAQIKIFTHSGKILTHAGKILVITS